MHEDGGRGRVLRRACRLARLAVDIGLPPATYAGLVVAGTATMTALLTATVVSAVVALTHVVRNRRLDPVTTFMLGSYLFSIVLALVSDDPRFVLARDPLTSALAGVVILASCRTGRPAMFLVSQQLHAADDTTAARWAEHLRWTPGIRAHYVRMSLVWGGTLVAEAGLRAVLIYTLPPRTAGLVSPVVELSAVALALCWTVWRQRRSRLARRLAEPVARWDARGVDGPAGRVAYPGPAGAIARLVDTVPATDPDTRP